MNPSVLRLIELALEEDLGRGDVTTAACVDPTTRGEGEILAKEALVVAGLEIAAAVFARVDPSVRFEALASDGDRVEAGAVVARVAGSAASLLTGERLALNFLQRLSGVATQTAAYVRAAGGARVRIADTRKTTPGMRLLERQAVAAGGGANHRFDLGSGILIKDNHIALGGGVRRTVERARAVASHGMKIEVEVDTLDQLDEALAAGADIVLLDNFTDAAIAQAQRRIKGRAVVEVSGGVTLARIPALAALGVDVISVGALTHSARAVDLSLDIRRAGAPDRRRQQDGQTDRRPRAARAPRARTNRDR